MAFSPWQAGVQKGVSLPTNLPTNIPTSLPDGWADTPIPDSPYTHGLGGQAPNSILGAANQTADNFKTAPGKIADTLKQGLIDWKNGVVKYAPVAMAGLAGAGGLAAILSGYSGAQDEDA